MALLELDVSNEGPAFLREISNQLQSQRVRSGSKDVEEISQRAKNKENREAGRVQELEKELRDANRRIESRRAELEIERRSHQQTKTENSVLKAQLNRLEAARAEEARQHRRREEELFSRSNELRAQLERAVTEAGEDRQAVGLAFEEELQQLLREQSSAEREELDRLAASSRAEICHLCEMLRMRERTVQSLSQELEADKHSTLAIADLFQQQLERLAGEKQSLLTRLEDLLIERNELRTQRAEL